MCSHIVVSANPGKLRRQLFHRQGSSGKDQVSRSSRRKLKIRKSQNSTRGSQHPGYVALPKSREALTWVPKRPRSEGSALIKEVNPLQRPRESIRPGTYREALIMVTNKRVLYHTASV
jgi:hypothetical protein